MVLKGKILTILDKNRLIVDIGFNQDIKKDMRFFVYELGDEIRDPLTNELIDRLEIIKHRLKVIHIQEKFSIMRSNEYLAPTTLSILAASRNESPIRKLKPFLLIENIDTNDETHQKKAIKIGDLVREDVN